MTELVLDASVIVKWVFPDRAGEGATSEAMAILEALRAARIRVVEPPHWLAEVAAVATRLDPTIARQAIPLLHAMELVVIDDLALYARACELAARLRHHLFDTLYHAVALERPEATLVTADDVYYRKARRLGAIARLDDLRVS